MLLAREGKRQNFEIQQSIIFFLAKTFLKTLFYKSLTCWDFIRNQPTWNMENIQHQPLLDILTHLRGWKILKVIVLTENSFRDTRSLKYCKWIIGLKNIHSPPFLTTSSLKANSPSSFYLVHHVQLAKKKKKVHTKTKPQFEEMKKHQNESQM